MDLDPRSRCGHAWLPTGTREGCAHGLSSWSLVVPGLEATEIQPIPSVPHP